MVNMWDNIKYILLFLSHIKIIDFLNQNTDNFVINHIFRNRINKKLIRKRIGRGNEKYAFINWGPM